MTVTFTVSVEVEEEFSELEAMASVIVEILQDNGINAVAASPWARPSDAGQQLANSISQLQL